MLEVEFSHNAELWPLTHSTAMKPSIGSRLQYIWRPSCNYSSRVSLQVANIIETSQDPRNDHSAIGPGMMEAVTPALTWPSSVTPWHSECTNSSSATDPRCSELKYYDTEVFTASNTPTLLSSIRPTERICTDCSYKNLVRERRERLLQSYTTLHFSFHHFRLIV